MLTVILVYKVNATLGESIPLFCKFLLFVISLVKHTDIKPHTMHCKYGLN